MTDVAGRRTAAGAAGPVVQLLRRHPLVSFFVIAFAISWTYVIVFLVVWPLPDTMVTPIPELFGPVVAGLVMTAVVSGKTGVRRLLHRILLWRVGVIWYLFVLLAIPALYLIGIALVPGALASFTPPALITSLFRYPILFLVTMILGGPLLEELGWRGFALPRLQRRWGPLAGSVILGILWGGWHAPQYLTTTFAASNGGVNAVGVTVFLFSTITISVIITWVFNHTRGSLLIAILAHQMINFSQLVTSEVFPAAAYNEVGPATVLGLAALVIVIATRGRLGLPRGAGVGALGESPSTATPASMDNR